MRTEIDKALALTPQEFAHLGDGAVAYVKTINSEDARVSSRRRRRFAPASSCSRCSAPTARRSC